ncbi:SMC-Scp complex subunit ScpB, partial [Micromonospora sp. MS34]
MSDEERRDSLADQAAAWVPPWERPTPPKPEPTPTADPQPAPDAAPDPSADLVREWPVEGPNSARISAATGGSPTGTAMEDEPTGAGEPSAAELARAE